MIGFCYCNQSFQNDSDRSGNCPGLEQADGVSSALCKHVQIEVIVCLISSHVCRAFSTWMQSLDEIASSAQFGLRGHLHWTFDAVV